MCCPVLAPAVLPECSAIEMDGNSLSGTLPDSISNLALLTSLNLVNNYINNSVSLTGTIPAALSNLTALEYVTISPTQCEVVIYLQLACTWFP